MQTSSSSQCRNALRNCKHGDCHKKTACLESARPPIYFRAARHVFTIALHKEAEVALGTMGISLDWGGFGYELISAAEIADVFPRLKMKHKFAETCRHLVMIETSYDNFLSDFGERLRARLPADIDRRRVDERAIRRVNGHDMVTGSMNERWVMLVD